MIAPYLRKGARFVDAAGKAWKVVSVNASRAHCVAQAKKSVTIKGRTFLATRTESIDISPNTPLELLRELAVRS